MLSEEKRIIKPKRRFAAPMLQVLLFLNIFFLETAFRHREFGNSSIDWEIIVRLVVFFASFTISLFYCKLWIGKLFRIDNMALLFLMVMFFISSFYSPSVAYSLGSSFSVLSVVMLVFACCAIVGDRGTLATIIGSVTIICLASIFLYVFFPPLGHMLEWVGGNHVVGRRLTGFVGSANGVGFITSVSLLLIYFCHKYYRFRHPVFYISILINLIALFMSDSRTSIVALALALSLIFFLRLTPARRALFFLSLAALCILVVTVDYQSLFAVLARTGDASEITTGTGRLFIWERALDLIAQKPLTGWGYASSSFILPAYEHELGGSAPHCHNIYLQLALSVGWLGPALLVAFLLLKTYIAVRSGDHLKLALIVFFFIGGLTEASAFAGVANLATIILACIAAMNYVRRNTTPVISYSSPVAIQTQNAL